MDFGISHHPRIALLSPLKRPATRRVLLTLPLVTPTITGQRSQHLCSSYNNEVLCRLGGRIPDKLCI